MAWIHSQLYWYRIANGFLCWKRLQLGHGLGHQWLRQGPARRRPPGDARHLRHRPEPERRARGAASDGGPRPALRHPRLREGPWPAVGLLLPRRPRHEPSLPPRHDLDGPAPRPDAGCHQRRRRRRRGLGAVPWPTPAMAAPTAAEAGAAGATGGRRRGERRWPPRGRGHVPGAQWRAGSILWFQRALGVRRPAQWEFSGIGLTSPLMLSSSDCDDLMSTCAYGTGIHMIAARRDLV